jgi:outer membrane protein
MKNGMLIWNILLTAVAGILLFLYFGNNNKGNTAKIVAADTLSKVSSTRIAYINMDSVEENYSYAREILDEVRKSEQDNNFKLQKMSDDYSKKLQGYVQQDQSAGLTQLSEAHQIDLRETEKRINDQKQLLEQEYVKRVSQLELNLRNKIKTYLKEYNSDRRYAYIMSLEDRVFYYVDTVYDITVDVIKGLNLQHKSKKE